MKTTRDYYHGWHDVAVFEDVNDGKTLTDFLSGHKFETRAHDDRLFRYFLFLRPPQITYRVQVRENHFAEATGLLDSKSPVVLERAIHCPTCGSRRVNYPQMTRKFMLPTVLLHLGIILRIIEHQCYCEHCHEMWNLPRIKPAARKESAVKPVAS